MTSCLVVDRVRDRIDAGSKTVDVRERIIRRIIDLDADLHFLETLTLQSTTSGVESRHVSSGEPQGAAEEREGPILERLPTDAIPIVVEALHSDSAVGREVEREVPTSLRVVVVLISVAAKREARQLPALDAAALVVGGDDGRLARVDPGAVPEGVIDDDVEKRTAAEAGVLVGALEVLPE